MPEVLERLKERREQWRRRLEERFPRLRRGPSPAKITVGEGGLIKTAGRVADRVAGTVKEARPRFIPALRERMEEFVPGKRVREVIGGEELAGEEEVPIVKAPEEEVPIVKGPEEEVPIG